MNVPVKILVGSGLPRPVTKFEKDSILKGLAKLGSNGSIIPIFDQDGRQMVCSVQADDLKGQIDNLIVIGKCQCGDPECHTVQFQHFKPGCSHQIVETELEDGRALRIFVNSEIGFLSGLEIVRD